MKTEYMVVYSEAARNDLHAIYRYIANTKMSPETAKRLTLKIRKKIYSLNIMPKRFAMLDWKPWKTMGLRKVAVDNYLIFYYVDEEHNNVIIVRIFYGGRDIETMNIE